MYKNASIEQGKKKNIYSVFIFVKGLLICLMSVPLFFCAHLRLIFFVLLNLFFNYLMSACRPSVNGLVLLSTSVESMEYCPNVEEI